MEYYTVKELHQKARDRGVTGYSHLRKAQLIKLLSSIPRKIPKGSPTRKRSSSPTRKRSSSPRRKRSVKDQIMDRGVEWFIVSMMGCGYCDSAKALLKKAGMAYGTVQLTEGNRDSIYLSVDSLTGKYRYFPMVFHRGKFLGGYNELNKMINGK